MIKRWKPWEKSTGPQSVEGKGKVARNAYKGGYRPRYREMVKELRETLKLQSEVLDLLDVD